MLWISWNHSVSNINNMSSAEMRYLLVRHIHLTLSYWPSCQGSSIATHTQYIITRWNGFSALSTPLEISIRAEWGRGDTCWYGVATQGCLWNPCVLQRGSLHWSFMDQRRKQWCWGYRRSDWIHIYTNAITPTLYPDVMEPWSVCAADQESRRRGEFHLPSSLQCPLQILQITHFLWRLNKLHPVVIIGINVWLCTAVLAPRSIKS